MEGGLFPYDESTAELFDVEYRPDWKPATETTLPTAAPASLIRSAPDEHEFKRMIAVERKRTERSRVPFLLMLFEGSNHLSAETNEKTLHRAMTALLASIRTTDVVGWYKDRAAIGLIFTGLVVSDKNALLSAILSRVSTALQSSLTADQYNLLTFSFHFFPEDREFEDLKGDPALFPDLATRSSAKA
jgi:hypothetical protein